MINIIPFLLKKDGQKASMDEIKAENSDVAWITILKNVKKLEKVGFIATDRKAPNGKVRNIWLTDKEYDCTQMDWFTNNKRRKK